tara:strand:+ start:390 stop:545 length:156 start_codon:yes stop_codon:yes gene_type:complete
VLKFVNEKNKTERLLIVGPKAGIHTSRLIVRQEGMSKAYVKKHIVRKAFGR